MNFCLGTVQFGMDYGIQGNGKPAFNAVKEMLNTAIDSGITVLDTASAYGEAESVLGRYMNDFPEAKTKVRVVSKLNPAAFANIATSEWGSVAVSEARDSLNRLNISKLHAYLFHNASYIFNEDAVKALNKVREARLADMIGVSIYSPEEAMKALEYSEIQAIQIPYNLFDRRLDKAGFFEKAKHKGVTVFARSSLLQGFVMMDPDRLPSRIRFAKDYLVDYLDICHKYKCDPLAVAIGYVSQKKGIDYVVFGVDNLNQLGEYISIKNVQLPNKMINEIDSTFADVEEKLVNPSMWKDEA